MKKRQRRGRTQLSSSRFCRLAEEKHYDSERVPWKPSQTGATAFGDGKETTSAAISARLMWRPRDPCQILFAPAPYDDTQSRRSGTSAPDRSPPIPPNYGGVIVIPKRRVQVRRGRGAEPAAPPTNIAITADI
ncbi:hypothetical protein MTP99_000211 [Tenebrio molitor]|jgi:hypothetical protein|uniref:Uncharacterized protein n=1 Tax=Tenebrio molitor TaxID=7067 RepID=A0A8J6H8P2_TENMO|nr:hypothetical protein GEV33_012490 [Tenebrio molitor]KAJ3636692.1 hypothetical protein MTP99_000211 [Tenebrio molitor]